MRATDNRCTHDRIVGLACFQCPNGRAAASSNPTDPRDARIAELEAALAGADPSTHCATGCESCEQAGERVRAALSGGTPTLDRLVREATDAGRRKGLEEAAKVCEREGANEDNYGRGMDAEDMAHIIIAAVRALIEEERE